MCLVESLRYIQKLKGSNEILAAKILKITIKKVLRSYEGIKIKI